LISTKLGEYMSFLPNVHWGLGGNYIGGPSGGISRAIGGRITVGPGGGSIAVKSRNLILLIYLHFL